MRLNQFLAQHLGISRRQGDGWIEKGLVEVNGEIGQFSDRIENGHQVRVFRDNEWEELGEVVKTNVILFYKPIFCITSREDELKRKTIYNFLPKAYHNLKPAGRLDYMSEGLLVLSNNGELLQELTHPKHESQKTYLVGLKYPLRHEHVTEMAHGMILEGYELNPVEVETLHDDMLSQYNFLRPQSSFRWYRFTLSEGRNNQIRKMCEFFGQKVLRLIRFSQGQYSVTPELFRKKIIRVD